MIIDDSDGPLPAVYCQNCEDSESICRPVTYHDAHALINAAGRCCPMWALAGGGSEVLSGSCNGDVGVGQCRLSRHWNGCFNWGGLSSSTVFLLHSPAPSPVARQQTLPQITGYPDGK